jgi:hypothetical protein
MLGGGVTSIELPSFRSGSADGSVTSEGFGLPGTWYPTPTTHVSVDVGTVEPPAFVQSVAPPFDHKTDPEEYGTMVWSGEEVYSPKVTLVDSLAASTFMRARASWAASSVTLHSCKDHAASFLGGVLAADPAICLHLDIRPAGRVQRTVRQHLDGTSCAT